MRAKVGIVLGVALLLCLAAPGAAGAAQRFASPGGSGEACSQGAPCSLEVAVGEAKTGDEVIVGSGNYILLEGVAPGSLTKMEAPSDVQIHGDFSAPIPKIEVGPNSSFVGIELSRPGQTLSWVEVNATGGAISATVCSAGGRIDRVRATATGPSATAILAIDGCAISNVVAVASGEEAHAITAISNRANQAVVGSVTNSNAFATGLFSAAVLALYSDPILSQPGSFRLDLTNTIARGEGADVQGLAFDSGSTSIVVSHSNYEKVVLEEESATISDAGGNQTAAPLFVDAASGNYAEAAGSPTIDAGIATPAAGALDLAGNARSQGGSIDIGAYEVVIPPDPAITGLSVKPKAFAAANVGGAVVSKKKGKKAPVGGKVTYTLSAAGEVTFTVQRKTVKRRKGKKKKKVVFKPVKGSFAVSGAVGSNSFKFSGRLGGKALKPGAYRLVGSAGGAVKRASFKLVK